MPQNQLRRRKSQRIVTSAPSRRRSTDGARARSEGTENHACPPTIVRNMPQNQLRRRRNGLEVTSAPSRRRSPDGARARSEGTENHA